MMGVMPKLDPMARPILVLVGADQGLPTTFVIDGKGVIRSKTLGKPPNKFRKLQDVVDEALAAS